MKLEQNIGHKDKNMRLAGAAIAALGGIVIGGTVGSILVFIFIVLVITSISGFCPAYTLLGVNTSKNDAPKGACCGGGCHEEDKTEEPSGSCCAVDKKPEDK